jgi:hypothetical protein
VLLPVAKYIDTGWPDELVKNSPKM